MSIVSFAPYSSFTRSSGLIYLLANSARADGIPVKQLRCNGAFSICDKDSQAGGKRNFESCLNCIGEQQTLARWASMEMIELTRFISPEEIEASRRWLISVPTAQLLSASFVDYPGFARAEGSFQERMGTAVPDLQNKKHEQCARKLVITAIRAGIAMRRFLLKHTPRLILLDGGRDVLSKTLLEEVENLQGAGRVSTTVAVFSWNEIARANEVQLLRHNQAPQVIDTPLVFDDVARLRTDVASWPREIVQGLRQLRIQMDVEIPDFANVQAVAS